MNATPAGEPMPMPGRGTGLQPDASRQPLDWARAEDLLNTGAFCWLTTLGPGGAPQVRPVFAVWSESVVFVSSKETARKSRNLDADGRCAVATDTAGTHLVLEGTGARVRDAGTLGRASAAFEAVYGWPTTVDGERLDAPYGAPTSGGPPYAVYRIEPTTAYAFPADASFMPTRWRFPTD